jgi:hypothetical protein
MRHSGHCKSSGKVRMTLDRFSLEKIYMSFIRPILEYADVIWDSQNQSLINVMFRQFKEKNKNLLRLKLKSALKIEQISVTSYMVLSIIFLEDKHNILLHLSIFYEYQQFFSTPYLFLDTAARLQ